jgi:hypothetical protein
MAKSISVRFKRTNPRFHVFPNRMINNRRRQPAQPKTALCRIQWVVELEHTGEEVDHVDEVLDISIAPCPCFGELDL